MAMAVVAAGVLLSAGLLMAFLPADTQGTSGKASTMTLPGKETVQMGEDKTINGQLKDQNGNALAGEVVLIDATLPDGSAGSRSAVITDDSGKFTFMVTPTMSGQYKVSVSFDGNAVCRPSSHVIIIVVIVPPAAETVRTELALNGPGSVSAGGLANVTGILKTSEGKAISWAPVTVQITEPSGARRASTMTSGADGRFSLAIDAKKAGEYIVSASFEGTAMYAPSSSAFGFTAKEGAPAPPPAGAGEPRLNIAYTSGTWGNTIYYGMPERRSGPYPWSDRQYPGANEFKIESNGYGPDQPSGEVEIATFIKIGGIAPRWVGSTNIPEGTVEVRTFPPDATTPRLVNLFATPDGGCQGILVNSWSVFDHTWVYKKGVTDRNQLTFALDITKLGDYQVTIWEVHDHRDGTAVQVSNTLNWTVHVEGSRILSTSFDPGWTSYTNNTPYVIASTLSKSRQPDPDNVNLLRPVAYSGTVHNYLEVEGTAGYTVSVDGRTLRGEVVDGRLRFDLGTVSFSGRDSASIVFTMTAWDGRGHSYHLRSVDVATQEEVGAGYGYFYHPYW